jgi:hypothetical protein
MNWSSAYDEGYKVTPESVSPSRRRSPRKGRLTKSSLIEFFQVAGFRGDDAVVRASIAANLFSPRNIRLSVAIEKQEKVSP